MTSATALPGATRPGDSRSTALPWTLFAAVTVGAANYAYSVATTHLLPTHAYTVFAAGQALLVVVGTAATSGAPWVIASRLALPSLMKADRAAALRLGVRVSNLLAMLAAPLVTGWALSFADLTVSLLLGVVAALTVTATPGPGVLQGRGEFRGLAAYRLFEAGLRILVGAAAAAVFGTSAAALSGFALSALAMTAVSWRLVRSTLHSLGDPAPDPQRGSGRPLWLLVGAMSGAQCLAVTLANLDTVTVAVLGVPSRDAASYQVAATLGKVPVFLATALSVVAFRELSAQEPGPGRRAALTDTLRVYLRLAIPAALVVATVPRHPLRLLLPHGYESVSAVLPPAAACGLALGLVGLLVTGYQAEARFRKVLVALATSSVLLVATLTAGERLSGGLGFARAAGAGACAVALAWLLMASRDIATPGWWRIGRRQLLGLLPTPLLFGPWQAWGLGAATLVLAAAWTLAPRIPGRRAS